MPAVSASTTTSSTTSHTSTSHTSTSHTSTSHTSTCLTSGLTSSHTSTGLTVPPLLWRPSPLFRPRERWRYQRSHQHQSHCAATPVSARGDGAPRLVIFFDTHMAAPQKASPPLSQRGGAGVGFHSQKIPENPSLPSWEHLLPFPKRLLKKYRQIIDLLHDGYIQT